MNKQLKNILLNINSGYTFFVASMHMGLMTSLVLFWYASWEGLKLDTIQNNFGIPATLATKLFVILIPIMMITASAIHDASATTPDLALNDEALAQFSAIGDGP